MQSVASHFTSWSCVQATESAQQWEKRAQQLQQKYGKVDLAEHQRVQAELKAAQAELSKIRAEGVAQLAAVREELSKVSPPDWCAVQFKVTLLQPTRQTQSLASRCQMTCEQAVHKTQDSCPKAEHFQSCS